MSIFSQPLIILTGGAGFIGSAVLHTLNAQGFYNILVVDDLGTSDKWRNLVGKRFTDVIHKDTLFSWLQREPEQVGAIVHLGACSSTTERDANYLLENNYRYSVRLAEYALPRGIRFIYASSAATYGDGALGFSDEPLYLTRYAPLNMYGYSKHLFDLWIARNGWLNTAVGLKYFNVYGPNEYHKGAMASAIVKLVAELRASGTLSLFMSSDPAHYPDGGQLRDFIYVKDAAAMTVQFLRNTHGGHFNIATGKARTWNALAQAVADALELPCQVRYIPLPPPLVGKYQNYTQGDLGKTYRLGLLQPQYSLEEGVADYVRHYLIAEKTL